MKHLSVLFKFAHRFPFILVDVPRRFAPSLLFIKAAISMKMILVFLLRGILLIVSFVNFYAVHDRSEFGDLRCAMVITISLATKAGICVIVGLRR